MTSLNLLFTVNYKNRVLHKVCSSIYYERIEKIIVLIGDEMKKSWILKLKTKKKFWIWNVIVQNKFEMRNGY